MHFARFDTCFLPRTIENQLTGIAGSATNDSINTGTAEYCEAEVEATRDFVSSTKSDLPLRFLGCIVNRDD